MQHKLRLFAVATAAALAGSLVSAGASAAAEPAGTGEGIRVVGDFRPAKAAPGEVGHRSATSGGRSGDFTTDYVPDIMARQGNDGTLKVYPHSRSFQGIYTYQPAVAINYGWSGFRWVGQGRINADTNADVVSIDQQGTMRVYPHSGVFNGTATLAPPTVVGYGWNVNDLVAFGDLTGDGYDDIVARGRGGNYAYLYEHSGAYNGVSTFKAPITLLEGVRNTVEMNLADITLDGVPDLVYLEPADTLGVFSFMDGPPDENGYPLGDQWDLGYGWDTLNAVTVTEVNGDGRPDVMGRRHNGDLVVYPHAPTWNPANPLATLQAPVLLGWGWQTNDVIS
ncbi:FG-GAP repeat domain-containing protein [Saccharothrix algeriensis]|uniref:VCBS repeat-containing protein n=1 Tax=Saccharothrix algeriensis TaxID=173560 RepID=A0A8T8I518_9PSEU|nr:VCBS repeat-containing protein [Saccharothrix algeriensis]MBM7812042.1 hypothetical protein [Saccharothrix algeriensis]QTR05721.1 VCBS repeat-containing protein [Saccharothrix algeriensis]